MATSAAAAAARHRAVFPSAALLILGVTLPFIVPSTVLPAAIIAVGAALLGSYRAADPHAALTARSVLLATSAFAYPFFLGLGAIAWAAAAASAAIAVVGWVRPRSERLAVVQVLAVALAVALAAAAAQFFFPQSWALAAIVAIVLLGFLLAVAGTTDAFLAASIATLVLAEAFLVLRYLPTHWAVNGAIVAFAFAAITARDRLPRTAFTTLMITLALIGAVR